MLGPACWLFKPYRSVALVLRAVTLGRYYVLHINRVREALVSYINRSYLVLLQTRSKS